MYLRLHTGSLRKIVGFVSTLKPYLHWPEGLHRDPEGHWTETSGDPVTDADTLKRLGALALPPAWRHVWASKDPTARVQARGIDSRGRVQYRYSREAMERAAENRFDHMLHFAQTLPMMRAKVLASLRRRPPKPDADQVTALAVRLLDLGLFRVGTDRYVHDNHTYGLTTLEPSHVSVAGHVINFDFIGKEHLRQVHSVEDRHAASVMRRQLEALADAGRGPLFRTFVDPAHRVNSATVNTYIHSATGSAGSAKVFRTWGATVIAAAVMAGATHPAQKAHRDPTLHAYDAAAHVLGNTPTMARNSYVYPKAVEVGGTAKAKTVVEEAIARLGTSNVEKLFPDQTLQESILQLLLDEERA